MIIGITGLNSSGKSVVATYLEEKKGFEYLSANKILSKEAQKLGLTNDREDLRNIANNLREKYGNNALIIKAKEYFKSENIVIESIRNTGEVEELKKEKDFYLIGIDADINLRYQRAKKRNRDKDVESFEEFKKSEELELNSTNPNSQNILKTYSQIDYEIKNDLDLKNLYSKIDILINDIKKIKTKEERFENTYYTIYKFDNKIIRRPFKNKYFLNIAKQVSMRSTCLSVQYGCCIIDGDEIVSTGYVGAPRKVNSSLERGSCLRRELGIESGQRYEICRSIHAEQNAIINAARTGVKIVGSDMYFYGAKYENDGLGSTSLIKGFPCFICKKMIINAGIKNFVTIDENGRIVVYDVNQWQKEWSRGDILDCKEEYRVKY